MGLGRIRKYNRGPRFAGYSRSHQHGWTGWVPPRLKRMSVKRFHMWLVRHKLVELKGKDNWEGIVREVDLTNQVPF